MISARPGSRSSQVRSRIRWSSARRQVAADMGHGRWAKDRRSLVFPISQRALISQPRLPHRILELRQEVVYLRATASSIALLPLRGCFRSPESAREQRITRSGSRCRATTKNQQSSPRCFFRPSRAWRLRAPGPPPTSSEVSTGRIPGTTSRLASFTCRASPRPTRTTRHSRWATPS